MHAIRKLGFFDWNLTCVKLENWGYLLELNVHGIKKPMNQNMEHTLSQFNSLIVEWQEHTTIFITTFSQDGECARCIKFQCGWTRFFFPSFWFIPFCLLYLYLLFLLSLSLSLVLHVCVFIYSEGLDSKSSRVVGAYCRSLSSLTIRSNHWSLSPHQSYRIELLFNYI